MLYRQAWPSASSYSRSMQPFFNKPSRIVRASGTLRALCPHSVRTSKGSWTDFHVDKVLARLRGLRSSCASQEFLPHVDGRATYVKIPVGQMITPMRTSSLHPDPDLELQNAAFVAAQGLLVSKVTPNQRAGLIPLTCCVCPTILLSHRASQVLNS
jgi:hypothetical protein